MKKYFILCITYKIHITPFFTHKTLPTNASINGKRAINSFKFVILDDAKA